MSFAKIWEKSNYSCLVFNLNKDRRGDIILSVKEVPKNEKWQKQQTACTVTESASVMLAYLSLAFRPRISNRLFSEAEKSGGLSIPVLAKFCSCFFLCSVGLNWTTYCHQSRKGWFLCSIARFAKRKLISDGIYSSSQE